MNLTSSRLIIRNLKPSDLESFHSYRSNPEVTKYQGFDVMTREQALSFIEAHQRLQFGQPGQWVQYGIEEQASGKLIGDCALKLEDDVRIATIGITIMPDAQQKGYAKEVMMTLLNFLFNLKDFHRVVEIVDAENTSSIALLESIGFKREGHFIENIFFKGKWGSEFQYAMLRPDWEAIVKR